MSKKYIDKTTPRMDVYHNLVTKKINYKSINNIQRERERERAHKR